MIQEFKNRKEFIDDIYGIIEDQAFEYGGKPEMTKDEFVGLCNKYFNGNLQYFLESMEALGIEHHLAFILRRQPIGCDWTASFIREGGREVCRQNLRSFNRMQPVDWGAVHYKLLEGVKNYETSISMQSEEV